MNIIEQIQAASKALNEQAVNMDEHRYLYVPWWFVKLINKRRYPHLQSKHERKQKRRSRVPSTGYYKKPC